ncbi:flagellar biosynthesis protein [Aliiroseovarius sp. S1339]|uniref:flagellar biosynthesis protein n=1 Tax=Aliiroseovarius sp. S1339 TaxID=2936990 RepID=UPI0020BFF75A|nr:flagellar biosynthesis protein [Aliiroseovarius sp. S1339]MCK8465410.1 flagellar biosynthesis protein [Aliiroseovarius sp. S1339]
MNKPLTLEDFDLANLSGAPSGAQRIAEAELEKIRLTSYETGYSAGWDDALKESDGDKGRIEAEFARNLEDLGFTFHEARSHVLGSLEPLLRAIVDTLLPEVVQEALGHVINDELLPLAEQAADTPIEVRVSAGSRPMLDHLMGRVNATPLEIFEDDTLPDGQVFLRSALSERCIDLTSALARIKGAVNALYDINEKAFDHG